MNNINEIISNLKEIYNSCIFHYSSAEWGGSILIMEKNGNGFIRTYWFSDNNKNIFIDWLSVSENMRNNGLGKLLINICEHIAKILNYEYCALWVFNDTWMLDWYKRLDYVFWYKNENENNSTWLKKKLKYECE